jgi:retinol dehydrogenase-12
VYLRLTTGYTDENINLKGKTAIVTGANTGLGFYTAKVFAKNGANVILAVRSLERGQNAANEIKKAYPNSSVTVKKLDLGDLNNVNQFVKEFGSATPLHILVNNAGIAMAPEDAKKEEQDYESMFMTNHVGHYLLTKKLLPNMEKSNTEDDPGRIIIVSSEAHTFVTKVNLENVERFTKLPVFKTSGNSLTNNLNQYGFTKLANLYHMYALTESLKQNGTKNITVNALHPGAVNTELNREVKSLPIYQRIFILPLLAVAEVVFFKDVSAGAQTQIHLACSPKVHGISGLYFSDCKEKEPTKIARDTEIRQKLIDITEKIIEPYL